MADRITCCIPYCKRTLRNDKGYKEWICGKHWPLVPRTSKSDYAREKRIARKIVARKPLYREWWKYPGGSSDRLAAIRMWKKLDETWERCKQQAIEAAMGIR